ncbi:Hsp20/alpha crystallin family protein [bacterium]|nr:Hsp20/alpha crystallin family protein [bacterium]
MDTFWDGRREIRELRARMDQAFRLATQRQPSRQAALAPPLDFAADAEGFHVALDLPGVTRESLNVQAEHGALVVTGDKRAPEAGERRVLRQERAYGPFARTMPLPEEADLSQVTASLKDGELHITVGRKAEAAARRIEVVTG